MLREPVLFFVLGAVALGCASPDVRPGSNTSLCVPRDGGPPCRGSPTGPGTPTTMDSGAPAVDSGAPSDAATTVTGTLRLFSSLPPGTVTTISSGWTVRALPSPDPDAGAPMLEATTTGLGEFTLAGVPPAGTDPDTGLAAFWLEATFPVMGNVGSMFEWPADTRSVELRAVTDDTLRVSLNSVGFVQADDRAVIAAYIRQSRTTGAAAVTGVLLQADGQASATLYDGPSGLMEVSATGTGSAGFAILPNVPVPVSGDGFIAVTGPRLTRTYRVRVRRHTMSWVLLTAI